VRHNARLPFTLLYLLVVFALIAILVALLSSALLLSGVVTGKAETQRFHHCLYNILRLS